jgi:hypothetical protein
MKRISFLLFCLLLGCENDAEPKYGRPHHTRSAEATTESEQPTTASENAWSSEEEKVPFTEPRSEIDQRHDYKMEPRHYDYERSMDKLEGIQRTPGK